MTSQLEILAKAAKACPTPEQMADYAESIGDPVPRQVLQFMEQERKDPMYARIAANKGGRVISDSQEMAVIEFPEKADIDQDYISNLAFVANKQLEIRRYTR